MGEAANHSDLSDSECNLTRAAAANGCCYQSLAIISHSRAISFQSIQLSCLKILEYLKFSLPLPKSLENEHRQWDLEY